VTVYSFSQQLSKGKQSESMLDDYFRKWYTVENVPIEFEKKLHYDRLFIRPDGSQITVEYKTDYMGHQTGNLIVEIVSNDKYDVPGWAYSCRADMLVWWVTGSHELLGVSPAAIREKLPEWESVYRRVSIKNEGYNTIGIAVPIVVFKSICLWIREFNR
jgi:hypothetical protein